MTPEQIVEHLKSYHARLERIASEEREREEREAELFRRQQEACRSVIQEVAEPLLDRLYSILQDAGHESVVHPVIENELTTSRTNLKTVEYTASISVEQKKGTLILRIVAKPDTMRVSAWIGVPHTNCSSVFHVTDGPLSDTEDVTNRGIADFVAAAFPLR